MPEWNEFLQRMAASENESEVHRWAAYRSATIELARCRAREIFFPHNLDHNADLLFEARGSGALDCKGHLAGS